MKCYTIYDHPRDYPDHFVVRTWLVKPGKPEPEPTDEVRLTDTLEEARKHIPPQCVCFQRNEEDDPAVLETWL
jgi:hypothetical protein